jgi:hypothetical protein
MVPHVEGGASKMPGTYFVGPARYYNKKARLVPFHFSSEQAYVLEFGDKYIRVFKDEGQVIVGSEIDNFDPTDEYKVWWYAKTGKTWKLDFTGNKYLYITQPHEATNIADLTISVQPNTEDTLSVIQEAANSPNIIIKLAKTTASKNAASLIQAALRGLDAIDVITAIDPCKPVASADDCTVSVEEQVMGSLTRTYISFGLGEYYEGTNHAGIRFANVPIPQGATIHSAKITFKAHSTQTTANCNIRIKGEDATHPVVYSTYANFAARIKTTAYQDWDAIESWAANSDYDSPDITDIIQEIVNRVGWESGHNLGIFLEDHGSTGFHFRTAKSFDGDATYCPRLIIEVAEEIDMTGWTVTENAAYAAARPITAAITEQHYDLETAFWQAKEIVTGNATNTSKFPSADYPTEWDEVTISDGCQIESPYLEADLFDLDIRTQTADILYIFHPSYPPAKLIRFSHTNWQLKELLCLGSEAKTITAITRANPGVVTCTAHGFDTGDQIYITDVLGMENVNENTYTITKINDNSFSIGVDTSGYEIYTSAGTATQRLFYAEGDYPACDTFYEQRLAVAGSNNDPQTIDFSVSGDYENFVPDPAVDDAAVTYTIVSGKVDRIRWLIGQEFLFAGTIGGIWKVGATNLMEPLTQTNIVAKKQVSIGVSKVKPKVVTDSILWLTRSGRQIREIQYSLEKDRWTTPDRTRIAKHITIADTVAHSKIVDMDFQAEPLPILWSVRADGELLGMTFEIEEQVYAWFRIDFGDDIVESVAVITEDDQEDQVWVIVQRTDENGDPARHIEYFKPHEFFEDVKDCFFVHGGLTWDGGSAVAITNITKANPAVVTSADHGLSNGDHVRIEDVLGMTEVNQELGQAYTVVNVSDDTFQLSGIDSTGYTPYTSGGTFREVANNFSSGLDHLEGREVVALIDGIAHDAITVTDGVLVPSLTRYGNLIHIGLSYESVLETMAIHIGDLGSSSKNRKLKISKMILSFYKTVGAEYGPDKDNLYDVEFDEETTLGLFTGDKEIPFPGDWKKDTRIYVRSDQPLPMMVLAAAPRVHISDD